jgi:predicted RNase H-like HicB family nuclease
MQYGVVFEKIDEPGFPSGYYYAHIPTLGLTTHGVGIDGAREAAADLIALWLAEKRANGEHVALPTELLYSTVEVDEDAVQSA